ncbi:MAG: hypothetical protein LR001_06320 [Clostridiales bacterium]|nr:hypothetical protein [Clostridiales bacterium]
MDVLSNTTKKARKVHICDWCNQPIIKGEAYEVQRSISEGVFCTWKSHINCEEVFDKLNMSSLDNGNGISESEFMFEVYIFLQHNLSDVEFEKLKEKDLVYKVLSIIKEKK